MMKKISYLAIVTFICGITVLPLFQAQSRNFDQDSPVKIVGDIKNEANKRISDEVQNTDLDVVTSKASECSGIAPDSRFSITRTLCSIKANLKDYLQYVVYFGLAAATIFIIRNGFKIVTSSDREKQLGTFKKNLLYIVIGIVLLTGFYYVIDIFVSIVNLVTE